VTSLDEVAGIFDSYLENRDRYETPAHAAPASDDFETVAV
jgi:hypothetical protein